MKVTNCKCFNYKNSIFRFYGVDENRNSTILLQGVEFEDKYKAIEIGKSLLECNSKIETVFIEARNIKNKNTSYLTVAIIDK